MNDRPDRTEGMLALSWSRINTLQLCEISYQKGYVEGVRTPRSFAAWRGSLVDLLIQRALTPPAGAGYDMPLELAAIEIAKGLWLEGVYDDGRVYNEWNPEWIENAGEITSALALTRGYMAKIGCKLDLDFANDKPLQKWLRVVLDSPGGPIEVVAVPDVFSRQRVCRDVKLRVRDKAAEHKWSEQLSIDAWAVWRLYGQEDVEVFIDRLDPGKPTKPSPRRSIRRLEDHIVTERRLLRYAEIIRAGMATGVWSPPAADSWKCQEAYCGHYPTCEWRRPWRPA